MDKNILISDLKETQENINLISERLYCIIKNIKQENITNKDKTIIKKLILEMVKNIETESYNALNTVYSIEIIH